MFINCGSTGNQGPFMLVIQEGQWTITVAVESGIAKHQIP